MLLVLHCSSAKGALNSIRSLLTCQWIMLVIKINRGSLTTSFGSYKIKVYLLRITSYNFFLIARWNTPWKEAIAISLHEVIWMVWFWTTWCKRSFDDLWRSSWGPWLEPVIWVLARVQCGGKWASPVINVNVTWVHHSWMLGKKLYFMADLAHLFKIFVVKWYTPDRCEQRSSRHQGGH